MARRDLERITSPGIALVALASALLIVVDRDRALLWLVPAPTLAAAGCAICIRFSLRHRAPGATAVFVAETLFWLATTGYLVYLTLNAQ
jgi:hypothetical protein